MRLIRCLMKTGAFPYLTSDFAESSPETCSRFLRQQQHIEIEPFHDDGTMMNNITLGSVDDDSYITAVPSLEILATDEDSSCYQSLSNETSENVDPNDFQRSISMNKNGAGKLLFDLNQYPNDTVKKKMERAEVDKLIAYILYLLTKRRHHPTDVNSNCIEREPFTFKKFLQMFRTARSASPDKERKSGILEGLFNRTEARSSLFTKKNPLPFGLLLNALSFSIDADGDDNYETAKRLVNSDFNEILTTSNNIHSFFNAFIVSYFALKSSAAEPAYLDLLDCIGKTKPSEQKIRNAINILAHDESKTVGLQTDLENRKYQQRGRGLNRDRCTVIEMKRNARRAKLSVDDGFRSETESPSFKSDDLQEAPLPKAIVKPRSVSRHRKLCANPQLSSMSSSSYCDSSQNTTNLTSTPLKSPPPPPPPLPPPPALLSSSSMGSLMLPSVVKSENTYKKSRATNTIHWEAVRSDVTVNNLTVFSGPDKSEANFSEEQRDRVQFNVDILISLLEKAFERIKRGFHDSQFRLGNKACSQVVQLLNEKRALSLGIVLAKFRPITVTQLVNMLETQAVNDLDTDTLDTLLKHYPQDEEINLFTKYSSPETLKDAELFCYLASGHPLLKLRIELKVISDFTRPDLTRQSECVTALLTACKNIYNSASINVLLRRCLQYGNFLNQSTFAAHASGFTLNSLLDVLRAKGTSENIRLVDILAEMAEPLLREVVDHIPPLKAIRGSTVEELEKSVGAAHRKVRGAMKDLQDCGDDGLCNFYMPSLRDALKKYDYLESLLKEIRHKEKDLQVFYCTPNMPLEKLLITLLDAICLFQDAVTAAKEKELRRLRQSKYRIVTAAKDGFNTPLKRRRNYIESPNVKDLVQLLDTTDATDILFFSH
ncbi:unnamed protein product [Enterobius vermicularis]|uniref:FH2 domain-containing protein n=1 Tax=Enterobius vermicularis TaxID=51028 RepID=A0A0N4UZP8_ENTVE|nr:unnamed protein product [Enterobius vermicularis]